MIHFNSSLDVVSIIALSAILSPILVALINNVFQYLRERQKLYVERKLYIIEHYIQVAGKCLYDDAFNQLYLLEYGEFSRQIYLYTPHSLHYLIAQIDNSIVNFNHDDGRIALTQLCSLLGRHFKH